MGQPSDPVGRFATYLSLVVNTATLASLFRNVPVIPDERQGTFRFVLLCIATIFTTATTQLYWLPQVQTAAINSMLILVFLVANLIWLLKYELETKDIFLVSAAGAMALALVWFTTLVLEFYDYFGVR